MTEKWMLSNRQPWVEGLLRRYYNCKTRSRNVHLPPEGATVFLHASKALWSDWKCLSWVKERGIDSRKLNRGGVCGVARLIRVGPTEDVMPPVDRAYFHCVRGSTLRFPGYDWNCAGAMSMYFSDVVRLPFIPCRGSQVPTRKLPAELVAWMNAHVQGPARDSWFRRDWAEGR